VAPFQGLLKNGVDKIEAKFRTFHSCLQ